MGGQDKQDQPEVPDLDLPVSRTGPKVSAPPSQRGAGSSAPPMADLGDLGDLGMGGIERGGGLPAISHAPPSLGGAAQKQIAIDLSNDDIGFGGMEIERGGGSPFVPSTPSGPPSAGARGPVSRAPASLGGSGLEISYNRVEHERRRAAGGAPSLAVRILAWVIPIVLSAGTFAGLVKVAHRAGVGRSAVDLLPHAFDATSTVQSGVVSGVALVLVIAVGFIGARSRPRSWAMLGSAATFLVLALAMVTVTLVSTEESPSPPDGALLVPYVVPAALVLLGIGMAARGAPLFRAGGGRRAAAFLVAIVGGALLFAGVELSALAARLP